MDFISIDEYGNFCNIHQESIHTSGITKEMILIRIRIVSLVVPVYVNEGVMIQQRN